VLPGRAPDLREDGPHGCYGSWVYIGRMVEGEDGEGVEVYERVRCHRCAARGQG
jgi:hypothetical protein